ncbi:MAG: 30S ribosomal protein S1 [Proteobacteria bacterium]|nr:30S ribosomal protein S1 [Pseudomonadota bacterium]
MPDTGDTIAQKEKTPEEMKELYENSMKTLQAGNIIKGRVININADSVIVDVGLKSEGKLSISEFTNKSGEQNVNIGDEVEVIIVGREMGFGLLLLSKQRADIIRIWEKVNKAAEDGTPMDGDITSEVKGGFLADIGVNAFLPISQVDIKPVKNPSSFVGRHLKFKVIKVNQRKGNVIISRRMFMEEERDRKKKEFWKNVKTDQVVYGIVRNITDYGAFIDMGGVDGLLYLNEITWGRITHPKEYLRVGDEIKVKVIDVDVEKERVSVSIKQLKQDPWLKIDEKYGAGTKVRGKVAGIVDYGVFVELEQGIEGLLHISEMSWDKRLKNPNKIVKKGDWIDLIVLVVDKEKNRVSLGLKQLLPDPWEELVAQYPAGAVVKGRIKNITDFGMFVGIGNGIDGLVHMSEVSWSRRKNIVTETFKKGTVVEALVINVDKAQKKFSLSLKQLKESPWKGIMSRYQVGEIVEGYVTSITDFGAFVEIEEGIEGLIHLSEMDEAKGKHPSEIFNIDDKVKALILNIDAKDKRIGLSIKAINKVVEEKKAPEPVKNEENYFSSLADILEPATNKENNEIS